MVKIVLVMERLPIAQRLTQLLEKEQNMSLIRSDYLCAVTDALDFDAGVVLIEVPENGTRDLSYCLDLGMEIKKNRPACKIMLLCSERKTDTVADVIAAKHDGRIDDFLFYDCTTSYMITKMAMA